MDPGTHLCSELGGLGAGGPGRGGGAPSLLAKPRLSRAPPMSVLSPCCWGYKSARAGVGGGVEAVCSRGQRGSTQGHSGCGGEHPAHSPQPGAAPAPAGLRVWGDSSTPVWVLAALLGEKPFSLRAQRWRLYFPGNLSPLHQRILGPAMNVARVTVETSGFPGSQVLPLLHPGSGEGP